MSVNLPAGRDTAVLIVGAGPTGLTLALELARRHIPVRIIDAQDGPSSSSRALGIHARTLETFGHLSVLDRVLTAARMVNRFEVFANGSRQTSFGFDFTGLGYRLDGSAFLGQAQTESILRERLAEFNVSVEWGCELHTLHQDDTKVTTRLRSNGREHELCADWLIGADGGHSRVRKQLHLTFDGAGGETWLVADATLDGANLPANAIVMNRHSDGNLLLFPFPEPSRWRILETQVPPADTSLDQIRRSFERRLRSALGQPALQVTNVTWSSRFTIQQRQAARLRIGRCFLAGDAAHVHSPASGQGMNTGIQDAFNLGWKLALVISGAASERLLDSYESERRPVSAALLRSAQLATRLIQSRSGLLYHGLGLLLRLQALIAPLHRRIERGITRGMSHPMRPRRTYSDENGRIASRVLVSRSILP
jgi:NADPH-dependent dioxygenase